MVAALLPYLLSALQRVEKAAVSFDYKWVNRSDRARTDRCACLEFPVEIMVGCWPSSHDVRFGVRFFLRDDTQQLIDFHVEDQGIPRPAMRKAEVELRRRLRRSKEPKIRELSKRWTYFGDLVAVDLLTDEFSDVVRAVTVAE